MLLVYLVVSIIDIEDYKADFEIEEVTSVKKIEALLNQFEELEAKRNRLADSLSEYETRLKEFEDKVAKDNTTAKMIQEELENARLAAGLVPLEGPGIEIRLNDRKKDDILMNNPALTNYYIVHDSDLLNVINELRAAGAEAISINESRIMANTRISCGGPTITVGKDQRFAPPFIIRAIGDPDKLMAHFEKPDSIYNELVAWGLDCTIKKVDKISIPRYLGQIEYGFAKPVKEGEQ